MHSINKSNNLLGFVFIWVVRIPSPTPVWYVAVFTIVILVKQQISVVSTILSSQTEHTRLQRKKEQTLVRYY
jgi:uncharacterized membrane protein